jgi:regulatory protein
MEQNGSFSPDYLTAFEKASHYCVYQERCQWDVENKFREWHVDEALWDSIISELMVQNFIDEDRYAQAFVSGKIKIKRWGINKIITELKMRDITDYSIKKALKQLDMEIYVENLKYLVEIKRHSVVAESDFETKMKLSRYLMGKGYELEMINKFL